MLIAIAAAKNGLQDTVASNPNLRSLKSGRKGEEETLSTMPTLDKLYLGHWLYDFILYSVEHEMLRMQNLR